MTVVAVSQFLTKVLSLVYAGAYAQDSLRQGNGVKLRNCETGEMVMDGR